jgi:hypothetical protein
MSNGIANFAVDTWTILLITNSRLPQEANELYNDFLRKRLGAIFQKVRI